MLVITLFSKGPQYINIEQRLLQKLLYFNISKYIKELMYLGFEYSFYFPIILTLTSTKGFFYTSPLIRINELLKLNFEIKEFNLIFSNTKQKKSSYTDFLKIINLFNTVNPFSTSLYLMSNTGAKANWNQICQLIGVRGYLANATGDIFKIPVLNSFNKGLTLFEYFISCYGARKGILDTALKTADAGYLTRRLVESSQDISIKEYDCGSNNSIEYTVSLNTYGNLSFPFFLIILGKILKKNLIEHTTQKIIEFKSNYISTSLINKINKHKYMFNFNITSMKLCVLSRTICSTCFGYTTFKTNYLGKSVGVLAGQVIGEPGTQMTLRTFHTGGVSNSLSLLLKNKKNNIISNYFCFFNRYKYKLSSVLKTNTRKKTNYKKNSYILHIKKNLNNSLNKYLLFTVGNSTLNYFVNVCGKLIYLKNNIFLTKTVLSLLDINKIYQRKKSNKTNENMFNIYGSILFKKILQLLIQNKDKKWVFITLNKTVLFKTYLAKCSLIDTHKIILKKSKNQRYIKFSLIYYINFLYSNNYLSNQLSKTTILSFFRLFYSLNKYYIPELKNNMYFNKLFQIFKTNTTLLQLNKII